MVESSPLLRRKLQRGEAGGQVMEMFRAFVRPCRAGEQHHQDGYRDGPHARHHSRFEIMGATICLNL